MTRCNTKPSCRAFFDRDGARRNAVSLEIEYDEIVASRDGSLVAVTTDG